MFLNPQKLFLVVTNPWDIPGDVPLIASYSVTLLDSTPVVIAQAEPVGDRGVYLHLAAPLPYSTWVWVTSTLTYGGGIPFAPRSVQLIQHSKTVTVDTSQFQGVKATPEILPDLKSKVFFSPSLEQPKWPPSQIEVDTVSVCVDLVEHYNFPPFLDPQIFFLHSSLLTDPNYVLAGGNGFRYSEAVWGYHDLQEENLGSLSEVQCNGTLHETFDPTRVALLNNSYWTLEGTGTEPHPFICADNLTPIPSGATIGPFPLM